MIKKSSPEGKKSFGMSFLSWPDTKGVSTPLVSGCYLVKS